MRIGLVLVGDELLSGKRSDRHMPRTLELLHARGLELDWVQILGDDLRLLSHHYARTLADGDIVLSFGGIGATPDDRTRQAVAEAAGVELVLHPEAETILQRKFGDDLTPQRLEMGRFPAGARLIPNAWNGIPGFSFEHHHCVPGFPQMAWPMIEWVLDHHYPHLHQTDRQQEFAVRVQGLGESRLIPLMHELLRDHPQVRVSSLPHIEGDNGHIELGLRGLPEALTSAREAMLAGLRGLGIEWTEVTPPANPTGSQPPLADTGPRS